MKWNKKSHNEHFVAMLARCKPDSRPNYGALLFAYGTMCKSVWVPSLALVPVPQPQPSVYNAVGYKFHRW